MKGKIPLATPLKYEHIKNALAGIAAAVGRSCSVILLVG